MKNKTSISAIAGVALLVAATSASAKGARVTFEELDIDGDGQLTMIEITEHRMMNFSMSDADGDGNLSVEEMQAAAQVRANERVTKMFEKFDANADGVLSEDELPKPRRASKMFERLDDDGNGSISEQEFADAKGRMGRKYRRGQWCQRRDTGNN